MPRKLVVGLTLAVMTSLTAWLLFARQQPMESTPRIGIAESRVPNPSVDAEPATQEGTAILPSDFCAAS
jgi:hypothetical protein